MTPLRHAFARFAKLRERVALEYRYLIEVIGERARRQQAAHACADDDRMTTEMCHDTDFLLPEYLPSLARYGRQRLRFRPAAPWTASRRASDRRPRLIFSEDVIFR
jgi:hypothetical protein